MNIKRGLFRIWVVLSAAYITALGAIGSTYVYEEFREATFLEDTVAGKVFGYPLKCEAAIGLEGTDWIHTEPWRYNYRKTCWLTLESLKHRYPQFQGTEAFKLLTIAYENAGEYMPRPQPWWTLAGGIAWGFGLPLFVLLVGSAIYWALAGFAKAPKGAS